MERLLEQLENNDYAIKRINRRMEDINKGNWAYGFYDFEKRVELYNNAVELKKRVLRMRFRVLENMQSEVLKKMQNTSTETKNLRTLKVA